MPESLRRRPDDDGDAADDDDSALLRAFHLDLPRCNLAHSKGRLCTDHPNCVERLKRGMKSAPFWRAIADQVAEIAPGTSAVVSRPGPAVPGTLRGLVNLGATCFFNVFIQCLFCNSTFRDAVYDANGADDDVVRELQLLFTSLQCSGSAVCDPTALVELLGLRTDQQQDVQEFTHLLLALLRERLAPGFVSSQFEGAFIHKTTCLRCHRSSMRRSNFTELCIPITKDQFTIEYCLAAYLNTERLSGNNRYHCETCNDKCNADRSLELERIPPILHLQLLRFVYNRKTQTKVKLHIAVDIPLLLAFQNSFTGEVVVYDLQSVILHTGESTHSGHYYAEVRDELSGAWTRLNDGEVGPGQLVQGGRRICSDTAYMLVYGRRGRPLRRFARPSPALQLQVRERDTLAAVAGDAAVARQQALLKFLTTRRQQIATFWDQCSIQDDDDDFYLIDQGWLHDWLRGERGDALTHDDGRILNGALLCAEHGAADPRKVADFVRLPARAWRYLRDLNGCDVELARRSLCRSCAREVARQPCLTPAPPPVKRQRPESGLEAGTLARLRSIYKRGRPFPASQPPTIDKLFVVPATWFVAMNAWLKARTPATFPGPIANDALLCAHGASCLASIPADGVPMQMPSAKALIGAMHQGASTALVAVPEDDWAVLNDVFACAGPPVVVTITNVDADRPRLARQWHAVRCQIDPEPCRDPTCVAAMDEARRALASPSPAGSDAAQIQIQRLDQRRSLVTLDVRRSWTMATLKEQVAQVLGIDAAEQRLSFGDRDLNGDEDGRTLEQLAIPNDALLTLETAEAPALDDDLVEEGFFGTKLFKTVAILMEKERRDLANDAAIESKARFVPVAVNPFNIFPAPVDDERRQAKSRFAALIRAQEALQEPLL